MSETETITRNGLYGFEVRDIDKRRIDPDDRTRPDIKALWQVHHEIVNLAAQGYKQVDIAEILNISPVTVSNTLNSTLGEEKLSQIRQERDIDAKKTIEKIRVLRNKAIETYHQIFDSPNATNKEKLHVADTVLLELSGLRVPTKIQSAHITLTEDEIDEFKRRGTEAAREAGMVIDVEVEESA